MFWMSHRRYPQLPVNGSLNQHMAKQVSLFQTPVKSWLPMLANQMQPRRDMAVEGTACSPEGHPTPNFLLHVNAADCSTTLRCSNLKWKTFAGRKKKSITSLCILNSLIKVVSKSLSNAESSCGVCILESKVG